MTPVLACQLLALEAPIFRAISGTAHCEEQTCASHYQLQCTCCACSCACAGRRSHHGTDLWAANGWQRQTFGTCRRTNPSPGDLDAKLRALAAAVPLPPQSEEMKDKLLRTLADMENLRERTARTAAETKQYAVQVWAAGSPSRVMSGSHAAQLNWHSRRA